ncbi:hypothetical protein GJ496_003120 [Pomphorhynchus laevis]|nr:hypothetical protein GJ496_003120 [Pomphorhynchus laevis]
MTDIIDNVLKQCNTISESTDIYYDDILINETIIRSDEVSSHLNKFGLITKPPISLEGNRVLGLAISKDESGNLHFWRGCPINEIDLSNKRLSRRELFSVCGKLMSHCQIAGWLGVSTSFVKRLATGQKLRDYIGGKTYNPLKKIRTRVGILDHVYGIWSVESCKNCTVW